MSQANRPGPRATLPLIRRAVSTCKSTEEGLGQDSNGLDARRASAEAFVRGQSGGGWPALPDRHGDGGFTGGNTDRPGLRPLMADIGAGKVDCIVVYKVDRLRRSRPSRRTPWRGPMRPASCRPGWCRGSKAPGAGPGRGAGRVESWPRPPRGRTRVPPSGGLTLPLGGTRCSADVPAHRRSGPGPSPPSFLIISHNVLGPPRGGLIKWGVDSRPYPIDPPCVPGTRRLAA
jgi:site-specific DNA recombinase